MCLRTSRTAPQCKESRNHFLTFALDRPYAKRRSSSLEKLALSLAWPGTWFARASLNFLQPSSTISASTKIAEAPVMTSSCHDIATQLMTQAELVSWSVPVVNCQNILVRTHCAESQQHCPNTDMKHSAKVMDLLGKLGCRERVDNGKIGSSFQQNHALCTDESQ